MAGKTKVSFESNIKRLEQIVAGLEKSDVELDKSLKLYEEGAKLIEACRRQLSEAETRIEKIRPKGNGLEREPFEPQQ
ncbi:MAG: exodeoxyribonuclease VII small subunit [Anaerolineaceae bacterium]|nr:exodeoxyribonuclease VII small subunit [Anaerolineaceae bacterium]